MSREHKRSASKKSLIVTNKKEREMKTDTPWKPSPLLTAPLSPTKIYITSSKSQVGCKSRSKGENVSCSAVGSEGAVDVS